jgi:hypothetical protein
MEGDGDQNRIISISDFGFRISDCFEIESLTRENKNSRSFQPHQQRKNVTAGTPAPPPATARKRRHTIQSSGFPKETQVCHYLQNAQKFRSNGFLKIKKP